MSNAEAWASSPLSSSWSDSVFEMVFSLASPQLPLPGLRFLPATKYCESVISWVTRMMANYNQGTFSRHSSETLVLGDASVPSQPACYTGFHFCHTELGPSSLSHRQMAQPACPSPVTGVQVSPLPPSLPAAMDSLLNWMTPLVFPLVALPGFSMASQPRVWRPLFETNTPSD